MSKKIAVVLAVVAALSLALTVAASCGKCPADKGCASKAADKKECTAMKDKPCCAHQADMQAALKGLEADLAKMEKGIPAADQAAFMKEHQANLKKFIDAHAACQKECKMKADTKEAPKDAPKQAPKAETKEGGIKG